MYEKCLSESVSVTGVYIVCVRRKGEKPEGEKGDECNDNDDDVQVY